MKLLICGTRGAKLSYEDFVKEIPGLTYSEIIEGCCPDSPDMYAEGYAKEKGIPIKHYPANSGNYLKRNIEMVEEADAVLAFWNKYSYGTAHAIANAVMRNKKVWIVEVKK